MAESFPSQPERGFRSEQHAANTFGRMFAEGGNGDDEAPPGEPVVEGGDAPEPVIEDPEPAQGEEPEPGEGEEEAPETEAPAAEATYPVTVDGEVKQVPVAELVKGYMQQSDYTRKTQGLADERRAFEGERTGWASQRKQVAAQLDIIAPLLIEKIQAGRVAPERLAELERTDPGEYSRIVLKQQQEDGFLRHAAEQRRQLADQEAQEAQAAFEASKPRERLALMEMVPEFRGEISREAPDGFKYAVYDDVSKFLLGCGFTSEELGGLIDHRYVAVAYKAMLADRATRATAKAAPKLAKLPQPIRPGAAKPRLAPREAEARRNAARVRKLRETGSVSAAADAFAHMYRGES